MGDCAALRIVGAPEVRNALILNEIGVLIHGLGKLSAEFASQPHGFAHHLVLRRLTRGQDPYLGGEISAEAAILRALEPYELDGATPVADALRRRLADSAGHPHASGQRLEGALECILAQAGDGSGTYEPFERDRVLTLARAISADFRWQVQQEEAMEALQPPFIAVDGLLEGLDELPSAANLVEMQGRTWHPPQLLTPEVGLLRAIEASLDARWRPELVVSADRLYQVRQLFCAVLANQLLEINNIRKDGPGDLGSWFWRGRLYATNEEGVAALRSFDEGTLIKNEDKEASLWLGLRVITRWAYGKVVLRDAQGSRQTSLWEHIRLLAALHKASLAQTLIEGRWPQDDELGWRLLSVRLQQPTVRAITEVKQLLEIEYPLGNEVRSGGDDLVFSFPDLDEAKVQHLLHALGQEIDQSLGGEESVRLSSERVTEVRQVAELMGRI